MGKIHTTKTKKTATDEMIDQFPLHRHRQDSSLNQPNK
jgi:hypothetical protein